MLVRELDPSNNIPLARINLVFAELSQVKNVTCKRDDVRLHALCRINQHAQEEWINFNVMQILSDNHRLESIVVGPYIFVSVIESLNLDGAIVIDTSMLRNMSLVGVLLT